MNIKSILLDRVKQLSLKSYTNQSFLKKCIRLIQSNEGVIKRDNISRHFCCFFVPLHVPTKSIYLAHHIKAGGWIPPGGHIDPDETPESTVTREFQEELSFKLTDEVMSLFNISPVYIEHPKTCEVHYDFWYTVLCKKQTPFVYEKKEFHDAGWFPIEKAIQISKRDNEKNMLEKIKNLYFSSPV